MTDQNPNPNTLPSSGLPNIGDKFSRFLVLLFLVVEIAIFCCASFNTVFQNWNRFDFAAMGSLIFVTFLLSILDKVPTAAGTSGSFNYLVVISLVLALLCYLFGDIKEFFKEHSIKYDKEGLSITFTDYEKVKEIASKTETLYADLKERISLQEQTAASLTITMNDASGLIEFLTNSINAFSDSRSGLEGLIKASKEENNRYKLEASAMYKAVSDKYNYMQEGSYSFSTASWPFKPETASLPIILSSCLNFRRDGYLISYLISKVEPRLDIDKRDKIEFLVQIMRTCESLLGLKTAIRSLGRLIGIPVLGDYRPLIYNDIISWWDKNRNSPNISSFPMDLLK